jgi:hypothetical protein
VSIRIGIDARAAAEVPAGRGRVARELVRALARRDDANEYVLYGRSEWSDQPLDERTVGRYLDKLLLLAASTRARAERLLAAGGGPELEGCRSEQLAVRCALESLAKKSSFELIFTPATLDRFRTDDTLGELERLVAAATARRG